MNCLSANICLIDIYNNHSLGFETQYRKVGEENVYEGDHLPLQSTERALLPHILCASLGHDLTKRTLLIYGHVDVKLISPKESWKTDPFDLTLIDGFMYGRGVADDKGPVVAWMNAIEAFIVRFRKLSLLKLCYFLYEIGTLDTCLCQKPRLQSRAFMEGQSTMERHRGLYCIFLALLEWRIHRK